MFAQRQLHRGRGAHFQHQALRRKGTRPAQKTDQQRPQARQTGPHAARRRIKDVLMPPKAKLFVITYSVSMVLPAAIR